MSKIIDLWKAGKLKDALELRNGEGAKISAEFKKTIDLMVELNITSAKETALENSKTSNNSIVTNILVTIFTIILSVFIGYITARSISRPMGEVSKAMKKISNGDIMLQGINQDVMDQAGKRGDDKLSL